MQDSTAIARVSISIYHRGIAVREEGPRERESNATGSFHGFTLS